MIGTGAPKISLTMDRVEVKSPPGVSSWIISALAPLERARAMLSRIKSSTAGLMPPSITIRSTRATEGSFGWAKTEKAPMTRARNSPHLSRRGIELFKDILDVFPDKFFISRIAQQICRMERRHQFYAMVVVPHSPEAGDRN